MIWIFALGCKGFMLSFKEHRGTGMSLLATLKLCRELGFKYTACDDFYSLGRIQALSQVCRSIYNETILLHYSHNFFFFSSGAIPTFLRVTPPVFVNAVRQIGTNSVTSKRSVNSFGGLRLVGMACPRNNHLETLMREHEQQWLAADITVKKFVTGTNHWKMELHDEVRTPGAASGTQLMNDGVD